MLSCRSVVWVVLAAAGAMVGVSVRAEEKAGAPVSQPSVASPAEITTWIGELNDDRYLVRERATRRLLEAGPAAFDALQGAADGEAAEPADRSVWILRRQSNGKDMLLKRQALTHLAALKKRPQIAAAARATLADLDHKEALAAIEQLGGTYEEPEYVVVNGIPPGVLKLDDRWRGGDAGLIHVRHLQGMRAVRIIGTNVTLEGVKEFKNCPALQEVLLYRTKLTPEDIAKLRKLLPEQVTIDYRRGGLLGVRGSMPDTNGPAIVDNVQQGSAAAIAGIQAADVILKFNGEPVANFRSLTEKIAQHPPGDEVTLDVMREKQPLQFKVKLGSWEPE